MNITKYYKLLKNSPELQKGALLEWDEEDRKYRNMFLVDIKSDDQKNCFYSKKTVEENKEWFVEVKMKFEEVK